MQRGKWNHRREFFILAEDQNKLLEEYLKRLKDNYDELAEKPSCEAAPPQTIMLPMRDGIKLYTVCQTPVGNGPFPTIILRSCYPMQEPIYSFHAQEYCKRGFAYVYQFCRGTGSSQGEWVPNIHERNDGKDTLDWLDRQDWTESIGYTGCSYLAFTGWIIADIVPPKVKTLYLTHYGTDRFTSAYSNGLFRQDVLTAWAMENAGFPVTTDYLESAKYRPQINVDKDLWGKEISWYRDWITNTNRSDPYWQSGFWKELSEIPGKVNLPIYIGSGWYDHHLGSTLKTYEALSAESKKHSVLRIGAWNHAFQPCVDHIEKKHLENNDEKNSFNWFDRILRKKELPKGEVQTYRIGDDRWETYPTYPFEDTSKKTLYFSRHTHNQEIHCLPEKQDDHETSVSYTYNPDQPVMSHGAESLLRTWDEIGSLPQPACNWRDDVVSFLSQPLKKDFDLLGKITVKLYVSSSAEDTAFTAKLMEVYPDGKACNIRSGIITLAYRSGSDQPRGTYEPGTIVEAYISMWDISWQLHKGSQLRVDISSSDFPQYAVHTNHAGIWSLQEQAKTAEQVLYCGSVCSSQIILPVKE